MITIMMFSYIFEKFVNNKVGFIKNNVRINKCTSLYSTIACFSNGVMEHTGFTEFKHNGQVV